MLTRILAIALLCITMAAAVSAKDRLDAMTMIGQSDALYYFPPDHGVTDLVVDITIDQLATDTAAKQARISYYYAGEQRQRFIIEGLSANQTALQSSLQQLVEPMQNYLMPSRSSATFAALETKVTKASRQLLGVPTTEFYLVTGVSKDEKADIKEYRVLLDKDGLAYQVENVLANKLVIAARLENIRIGEQWHIGAVTTRLYTSSGPQWKIDRVKYDTVDGYMLPTEVMVQYRNSYNQPAKGVSELTIHFSNYRINKGVAAEKLPAPAPTVTPAP